MVLLPNRTQRWKSTRVVPCDDTVIHRGVGTSTRRKKKATCYNASQLAPALFNIARETKKMPAKLLKALLGPLVAGDIPGSLIKRTRAIAREVAQGKVHELLEQFPAYMAALESLGHHACAHIIDSETLSKSMLSWSKESHKLQQKGVEDDKRIEFDEDATKDLISSVIDSSCAYLVGFEVSPSSSRALWMSDDIRPVLDIDFAHMYETGRPAYFSKL